MKKILAFSLLCIISIISLAQAGGYSLQFNGTNDGDANGVCFALNNPTAMSLECWIKPVIGSDQYFLAFNNNDKSNNIQLGITSAGALKAFSGSVIATGSTLSSNKWYHVALTINASNQAIVYLDGVQDISMIISNRPQTNGLFSFAQEWDAGGKSNYYTGQLDDIRVWSTARSADEVRANMYKELAGSETGLVAYYKVSSSSGTNLTDAGPNSISGSVHTTVTRPVGGSMAGSRNCLDFDGSNDYVYANINNGVSSNMLTLEFWVRPKALNTQQNLIYINSPSSANRRIVPYITSSNEFSLFIANAAGTHSVLSSGVYAVVGKWYHLAISYNGGNAYFYVDGKLCASNLSAPLFALSGNDNLYIGCDNGSSFFSNCQFDELRIWNTARTQPQIRDYMCKSLSGNELNLLAYYTMDGSFSTTVPDFTGGGSNGTMYNMSVSTDRLASSAYSVWLGESNNWNTPSNWSNGSVPSGLESVGLYSMSTGNDPSIPDLASVNNFYISSGSNPTLNGSFTSSGHVFMDKGISIPYTGNTTNVYNDLFIGSGLTLNLHAGVSLYVQNYLHNQGTVHLHSDATGTAMIYPQNVYINGNMVSEQYIAQAGYHYISSPFVSNASIGELSDDVTIITGNPYISNDTSNTVSPFPTIFEYDETYASASLSLGWDDPGTVFVPGKGYALNVGGGNKTLDFDGNMQFNTVGYGVTYTNSGNPAADGWNLIGNPFPSSVNWNAVTKTVIANAYYVFNPTSMYSGTYYSYVNGISNPPSTLFNSIPPMQSFLVKSIASGSVSFPASARSLAPQTFYKTSAPIIRIKGGFTNQSEFDETTIYFDDLASESFEADYDAYKIAGNDTEIPNIFTRSAGNENLSINALNPNDLSATTIPLRFTVEHAGQSYINAYELSSRPNGLKVYLYDAKLDVLQELNTQPVYHFFAQTEDNTGRFYLRFAPTGLGTEELHSSAELYSENKNIHVTLLNEGRTELNVFNTVGQLVFSTLISGSGKNSYHTELPAGIYTVVLKGNRINESKKIVLK